jgi:hypothetical protein
MDEHANRPFQRRAQPRSRTSSWTGAGSKRGGGLGRASMPAMPGATRRGGRRSSGRRRRRRRWPPARSGFPVPAVSAAGVGEGVAGDLEEPDAETALRLNTLAGVAKTGQRARENRRRDVLGGSGIAKLVRPESINLGPYFYRAPRTGADHGEPPPRPGRSASYASKLPLACSCPLLNTGRVWPFSGPTTLSLVREGAGRVAYSGWSHVKCDASLTPLAPGFAAFVSWNCVSAVIRRAFIVQRSHRQTAVTRLVYGFPADASLA